MRKLLEIMVLVTAMEVWKRSQNTVLNKTRLATVTRSKWLITQVFDLKLYSVLLDILKMLVVFYSISTLIGYLMPNPVYTHILNIYDL